jgi:hypothetical protein
MPGHFTHIYTARRVADWLSGQRLFNPDDHGDGVSPLTGELSGISPAEAARVMTAWPRFTAIGAIGPDLFFFCQDYGSGPLAKTSFEDDALMLAMTIAYWVDEAADNDYAPMIALLAEIDTTFAQVVRLLLQLEKIWKDFQQAWDATIGPIVSSVGAALDDLTGGLISEAGDAIDALAAALKQVVVQELTTFQDIFSWFSLKMRQGWDEQSFLWSDMLHYRRTTDMARNLLAEADSQFKEDNDAIKRDQFRAFALGWICHVGTDVIAHSFVNEQAGGPFRTHWQRHHLVENHIDAWNYRQAGAGGTLPADPEVAATADYPDIGQSALHFAVAMDPDNPNGWPRPASPDDASVDKDGELPDWLAEGIVRALIATYHNNPGEPEPANLLGEGFYGNPLADILTRAGAVLAAAGINLAQPIEDLLHQVAPRPGFRVPAGYPLPWEVKLSYRFMITYYKKVFWGSFDLGKPRAPDVIIWPPASDWSDLASPPDFSGVDSSDPVEDICDAIAAIVDWISKEVQAVGKLVGDLIKALTSPLSYPVRMLLYELAMAAWDITSTTHDILAHTGFMLPHGEQVYPDNGELKLSNEIDQGLISLGHSLDASFLQALADAVDPFGNLDGQITASLHNPRDQGYPFLPVRGKQAAAALGPLGTDPNINEFRRPWAYPDMSRSTLPSQQLYPTPTEHSDIAAECQQAGIDEQQQTQVEDAVGLKSGTVSGPYPAGATPDQVLFRTNRTVSVTERSAYEAAPTPAVTDMLNIQLIGQDPGTDHNPLGDPIQFSGYLMGQILSTDYDVHFNLDADRGFGYRCWDWIRTSDPPITKRNGRDQPYTLPVVEPEGSPADDPGGAPPWLGAASPDYPSREETPIRLRYLASPSQQQGPGGGGGGDQRTQ